MNIHVLFAFWDSHFWKTVTVTVTVLLCTVSYTFGAGTLDIAC